MTEHAGTRLQFADDHASDASPVEISANIHGNFSGLRVGCASPERRESTVSDDDTVANCDNDRMFVRMVGEPGEPLFERERLGDERRGRSLDVGVEERVDRGGISRGR